MIQELTIDLRRPPKDRWPLSGAQTEQARELLILYKSDLGLRSDSAEFLTSIAKEFADSQRIHTLLGQKRPSDIEDCFSYLNDPEVRMRITVQQMVFNIAIGQKSVRVPDDYTL